MAFRLKSKAFDNDDEIPENFTADGDDISPRLSWSDPSPNTISFALVLEDRDAKEKKIHWLLWNLPATAHSLPEAVPRDPVLSDGTCQGLNDFRTIGYSGPRLEQVTEHKYEFTLYALNSKLDLKAGSTHAELTVLMGGGHAHGTNLERHVETVLTRTPIRRLAALDLQATILAFAHRECEEFGPNSARGAGNKHIHISSPIS